MKSMDQNLDIEYVRNLQPLVLASVGDAAHTLFVRSMFAKENKYKANDLSKAVSRIVNAGNQCKIYHKIVELLSEEELSVAKRAKWLMIRSNLASTRPS